MKMSLNDVANFETRQIRDLDSGASNALKKQRGWWDKQTGAYLGENRSEAEDIYQIKYGSRHSQSVEHQIEWR